MSISFGGLGVISLRRPFAELSYMILGKGDFRSTTLYAFFFCIALLVIAYLTNPSENSFRAYLTEQSFRQHLSRLDDDHLYPSDNVRSPFTRRPITSGRSFEASNPISNGHNRNTPFHFASRASVSLRTPEHVFHTFGILTIAAVVPIAAKDGNIKTHPHPGDGYGLVLDSWFIGAFGRWWRGGVIDAWYQDVVANSKAEEGWSSGILDMKALDRLHGYDGLPYSSKSVPLPARGSPPKLRNRERSSQSSGGPPTRSTTPPPLPKSASLPLHATRQSIPGSVDRSTSHSSQSLSTLAEQIQLGSPALASRSPSSLSQSFFDHSPLIADVLRQISQSKASIQDLSSQLSALQSSASESHSSLEAEVHSCRQRKKAEDVIRLEIKSKTKLLEDAKRGAEAAKRDTEKRLRAAEGRRDDAGRRIGSLEKDIFHLQEFLLSSSTLASGERAEKEQEITETLDSKRREIKVAEDVVNALNARTRDLEEMLGDGRERLRVAREQAEMRRQDRTFATLHVVNQNPVHDGSWSPITTEKPDTLPSLASDFRTIGDVSRSPRPASLSLGGLSNFNTNPTSDAHHSLLRSKGYSIFDDDIASLLSSHSQGQQPTGTPSTNFSPFDTDASVVSTPAQGSVPFIPTGFVRSMDGGSNSDNLNISSSMVNSRSFQLESDSYMDRGLKVPSKAVPLTASPISTQDATLEDEMHDPFEVRFPKDRPHRTTSDPHPHAADDAVLGEMVVGGGPRRWLSASCATKGLNPDAKVFQLPSKPTASSPKGHVSKPSFDALNPNGLGPTMMPSSSTNTSLLRAFAPSPAEREVLQRALGGSTNTSLDRLPSLPDVQALSVPSSPTRPPGQLHSIPDPQPCEAQRETGKTLLVPSWLRDLPQVKVPKFSPWEDEEPAKQGDK